MLFYVSEGGNSFPVQVDPEDLEMEQWRVSLGARPVSQSSTAGTLQDARNTFGTLPLSLTLMVRGGSKERNRALCMQLVSMLQGKVLVRSLKGYPLQIFIGNLKSYTIGDQTERWCTITLVIECEKWTEQSVSPIHYIDSGQSRDWGYRQNFNLSVAGEGETSKSIRLVEDHTGEHFGVLPGLLPTPLGLEITRSGSDALESVMITAGSTNRPENKWTFSLADVPAGGSFFLTPPYPFAVHGFEMEYDVYGTEHNANEVIDVITGWPVYAGGIMTLNMSVKTATGATGTNGVQITFVNDYWRLV